jgi:predicted TIM-barrel fold metal-dependent hydrolase
MKPAFDIHLHLFNKTFLAKELYFRLVQVIHHLLEPEEKRAEKGLLETAAKKLEKIKSIIQTLKRINNFLHTGFQANSTEICDELNSVYKNEFLLTPLMFDLTYCFVSTSAGTRELVFPVDHFQILEKQKKDFMKQVSRITAPAGKGARAVAPAGSREQKLTEDLSRELAEFDRLTKELKKSHRQDLTRKRTISRGMEGIPGEADGFTEQIVQLSNLKNHPKYKGRIFPFLAVDPRRPGILDYMKQNVGKGKMFIGVKLYTPNGYSPTDPLLYGSPANSDCVYSFCEKNKIPVTVHNSYGGFATFVDKVEISGDIFTAKGIKHMEKEFVSFRISLVNNPGNAIRERALALNHPSLWEKVLEKYPNLYLNLAHFGGGERLEMAIDNINDPESVNWSKKIMELILKFPNAYTDISCYSDFGVLQTLKASAIYSKIRPKIMYGSDYYLLLLFENDFRKNNKTFRDLFATDFDILSRDNPGKFLSNVL